MTTETRLWKAQIRYAKEAQKLGGILGSMVGSREGIASLQLFIRVKDIRHLGEQLSSMLITLAQDVGRHNREGQP